MTNSIPVLTLLAIHITFGFSSLLCALGAMLSTKGQYRHRKFGRCFFYSMSGVFVTAIPLAIITQSLFLLLIAIFSYYLAFSGWRYAKNRSGLPQKMDWVVGMVMLTASLAMIILGGYHFNGDSYKSIVLLVFGVIGSILSFTDLKDFRSGGVSGNLRIVKHLSAMLGATIAALTAFLVTNFSVQPAIILWLAPTVVLVPVIVWWKKRVLAGKY